MASFNPYSPEFREWTRKGRQQMEAARWEEAAQSFTKALQINSDHTPALFNRGICYNNLGNYPAALQDFNSILRQRPNDADAYVYRAQVYKNLGDLRRAGRDFSQAISYKRDEPEFYRLYGLCWYERGLFLPAVENFRRALYLRPNWAEIYQLIGLTYYRWEKWDSAIGSFTRAIDLDPNDVYSLLNRVSCHLNQAQFAQCEDEWHERMDQVRSDLSRVATLDPHNANLYYMRGAYSILNEAYRDGIADLHESIDIDPERTQCHVMLGRGYSGIGNYGAAAREYLLGEGAQFE